MTQNLSFDRTLDFVPIPPGVFDFSDNPARHGLLPPPSPSLSAGGRAAGPPVCGEDARTMEVRALDHHFRKLAQALVTCPLRDSCVPDTTHPTQPVDSRTTAKLGLRTTCGERLAAALIGRDGVASSDDGLTCPASACGEAADMIRGLIWAIDTKDGHTRRHCEEVMVLGGGIAQRLGLDLAKVRQIQLAGLLHDIGKVYLPLSILCKPGPLNSEEFAAVKRHPDMGAKVVETIPGLSHTVSAIRHHHERWDGHGYPTGLAGTAIPLSARVIAVADAFSAMIADRPYRRGLSEEAALAALKEGAGSQWSPVCVNALLECRREAVEH